MIIDQTWTETFTYASKLSDWDQTASVRIKPRRLLANKEVADGAYGAEHIQFRRRNMDPTISTFNWPDFGPVATALGGQGFTVRNLAELTDALAAIEHRTVPMLIDVKLDPFAQDDYA